MFRYYPQILKWTGIVHRNFYQCYIPHLMTTHHAQLTIKATRRSFLKRTVLNQNKQVIYAETRKPTDFVLKLKQQGKCPGVIIPYSQNKEQEVDIVLSGKSMKQYYLSTKYGLRRVHVRVEGKQYLCVLKQIRLHPNNFIQKVTLKEYVPGKPNHLKVPIRFSHIEQNKLILQGYHFNTQTKTVNIISYNHQYPTTFYVDVSYVNLDRPYTIGDLANTFPPGILLDPKQDPKTNYFWIFEPEGGVGTSNMGQILDALTESNNEKAKASQGGAAQTTPAAGNKQAPAATGKQPATAGKQPAATTGKQPAASTPASGKKGK